jgi:ABC-type Fe3+ transport system substrate-binding protein
MRIVALAFTAALIVSSACGPSGSAPTASVGSSGAVAQPAGSPVGQQTGGELSAEVRRLIQAARDGGEAELNVSWGATSLGGPDALKRVEAWMNQTYGTNIRINLTPGPSMPDMGLKITQELAAGHKASSDVYLGIETHIASLLPRDVLEPYDYTQLSPRIIRDVVAERDVAVEIYGSIPAILYNSDLVSRVEVPRRLEDVLEPRWKGRIAANETAGYFNGISARPEWGVERMKAYIGRLAQQVGGLIRVSEDHRIISGEFVMLVVGTSHTAREQQAKGAPLAAVVPEDVAQVNTLHLGVPRNSAHPNLAKLYINAMLSEAGQRILYEAGYVDHYQLPGSQSAADLAELQARGVAIQKVSVKFVVDRPELAELTREFQTILREKRS